MKTFFKHRTKARFAIAGLLAVLIAATSFVDSPRIASPSGEARSPASMGGADGSATASEFQAKLRGLLDDTGAILDTKTQAFESLLNEAERRGLSMETLLPGIRVPKKLLSAGDAPPRIQNEFGRKLAKALEFIDLEDLLIEMAQGRTEPWRRYDEPGKRMLLDRWNDATDPTRPIERVLDVFRVLSDDPNASYRDHEIIAGGDIYVDGKGYYRIDEAQKAVLEKNPYLTLDMRPDPYSPGKNLYLGRHEYPSASTYRKFKDRLSHELVTRLESAGDELTNRNSRQFKELTREIVRELVERAESSPSSAIKKYQDLISIHPFNDFNGRSMRAYYKRLTGNPLFMWSFDEDLFSTYPEFVAQVRAGEVEHRAILTALAEAEKKNPWFPDFYRESVPWQVGARIPNPAAAKPNFVDWIQGAYRRGDLQDLIRQKRYTEFVEQTGDLCQIRYRGLTGAHP